MARARGVLLELWPLALSLLLLAPLREPGHLLSRDLVFVPHEPLTDASLGLGGTAPRSVPLDAVVAVLTSVVDGGLLGRLALVVSLALAGWGVLRLTSELGVTARLAASGFAVWNPFVVERMALGQWALVLAYGALPWVVSAAATHRLTGSRAAFGAAGLWAALASLTPSGGLLALAGAGVGAASRRARSWVLVLVVATEQLAWVVPSLVGGAGRFSDPAGVSVFAPGSDASGHPALALLGLGGIWDGLSVPDSRHTPLALMAVLVVALSAVAGLRHWVSATGDLAPRLLVLGLTGLVLALALTTEPGQQVLRHAIDSVPGAGLGRDGQKLLAPFVVLVACLFGGAVDVVTRSLRRHGSEVVASVGLLLVALPLGLVPDAPGTVWRTVAPVRFPSALDDVATAVDAGPSRAALVTLPWRAYRDFAWGSGYPSSDPLVRMVGRPVVTSDDLAVGDRVVRGESSLDARVGDALARGRPADVLPRLGIAWVVVYADDPAARDVDVAGLRRVLATPQLSLYAVPGAAAYPSPEAWRRALVVGADVVVVGEVLAMLLLLLASRRFGRPRRTGTGDPPVLESAHPAAKEP